MKYGRVWLCARDKALGPYSFLFKFIKHYWLVLTDNIVTYVKGFFSQMSYTSRV